MRRVLRTAAFVVGVVSLTFFLSGGGGSRGFESREEKRQERWSTLGNPWPWYENRTVEKRRPDGSESAFNEAGPILNSPAWLLLIGGVAGVAAFLRLRPAEPEVGST
jgi:hypothetical protein